MIVKLPGSTNNHLKSVITSHVNLKGLGVYSIKAAARVCAKKKLFKQVSPNTSAIGRTKRYSLNITPLVDFVREPSLRFLIG